jgi:hypothetical protein
MKPHYDERFASSWRNITKNRIIKSLDNVLIFPVDGQTSIHDRVACRERLGGLLKYYHRPAAC